MARRDREWVIPAVTALVDVVSINAAFLFAFWLRFYAGVIPAPKGIPSFESYVLPMVVITPLFLVIFEMSGLYKVSTMRGELWRVVKGVSLVMVAFMAITFLYKEISSSRVFLALFWLSSAMVVSMMRGVMRIFFLRM